MPIKELVARWEDDGKGVPTDQIYKIHLTREDAAKLDALAEMYPRRNREQLLSELVSAALQELENCFPYVEGNEVAMTDEFGDPMYVDEGRTPTFIELTRKHLESAKSA